MREIKFRGRVKNTINPQWVYGIVIPPQYSSWEDWTLFDGERRWIVDPETVGQYTGYKDADGKEIYEGDIFKVIDEPDVGAMVVLYGENPGTLRSRENYGFYVRFTSKELNEIYRQDFLFWHRKSVRVIGNIHDNPRVCKG